jgi:hypothetical protein
MRRITDGLSESELDTLSGQLLYRLYGQTVNAGSGAVSGAQSAVPPDTGAGRSFEIRAVIAKKGTNPLAFFGKLIKILPRGGNTRGSEAVAAEFEEERLPIGYAEDASSAFHEKLNQVPVSAAPRQDMSHDPAARDTLIESLDRLTHTRRGARRELLRGERVSAPGEFLPEERARVPRGEPEAGGVSAAAYDVHGRFFGAEGIRGSAMSEVSDYFRRDTRRYDGGYDRY